MNGRIMQLYPGGSDGKDFFACGKLDGFCVAVV